MKSIVPMGLLKVYSLLVFYSAGSRLPASGRSVTCLNALAGRLGPKQCSLLTTVLLLQKEEP
ncbi:hypothetical protein [Shivajiella indica]|uniref:Uncharacterized protein n=1 Tax=Shivajiella indica TaxID=872115 RepID=A0ABW5B8Q9_9BACT